MNRLETELRRLYLPARAGQEEPLPERPELIAPDGGTRALMLELVQPAGWREVAQAWQAVQAELQWPAPVIAVSGVDAYQLWFSLEQPVAAAQAHAFLEALRQRHLDTVPPERIFLYPAPDAAAPTGFAHAVRLPPARVASECWAAFVAPDLAPVFEEERWLDQPPGADAQAELLSRARPISAEAFVRGLAQLARVQEQPAAPAPLPPGDGDALEPRAFLLAVMRDPAVPLRLRIEAAKALLPP